MAVTPALLADLTGSLPAEASVVRVLLRSEGESVPCWGSQKQNSGEIILMMSFLVRKIHS